MDSALTLALILPVLVWLAGPSQATEAPTKDQAAIIARCVEEMGLVYPAMACDGLVTEQCIGTQYQNSHMIYCTVQEYMVWDQRLNAAYAKIMKVASPEVKASLKSAQRAWIEFRDDTCSANALLFQGGTHASLIMAGCMGTQTAVRSLQLEQFLIEVEFQ